MISLINVVNNIDLHNAPVGHSFKVLYDMERIIGRGKAEILAGSEYIKDYKNNKKSLPYSIRTGEHNAVGIKVLCNYLISLVKSKGDILIYVVALEPLLWGIALIKPKRNIVVVTYENWDLYIKNNLKGKFIRRIFVQRGLKRLDGCIVTNSMYVPPTRYVRVPDYYMTDEMSKYNGKNKKDGCVCLGEMRYGKDIAGLARVASKTDIKLTIIGAFQSKELYLKARKYQSDKITIIDRNLTYEEYLEYLSSYKYVVLPYDAKYYDGRTSGVLLEGIFVGAIPIAPKKLLEQNKIQGLGYQKISDIPDLIKCYEQGKITVHNNLDKYSYEYVSKKLLHFLKGIN